VDYVSALLRQNKLLGELVGDADATTPVPACPGWNLSQLVRHVGRGDRWAAQIISDRVDHFLDPRTVRDGKPPADPAAFIPWLNESPRTVVDAVAQAGEQTPVWTFLGPRPAAWWVRRRLHESTVHRADAALALGVEYELEAPLAADGLSEWLDLVAARAGGDAPPPLEDGTTLHLHATDDELGSAGEWLLHGGPDGVRWESGHAKGDCAVRAPAVDLLLLVLRRRSLEDSQGVALFGDENVLSTWLERTGF
jgi:uncharacterized protein (TIGR03083 family)